MRFLITFLLLLVYVSNAYSSIEKIPLFKLNKNEIPSWSEYHFQLKSDGLKLAILTEDTVTKKESFIWNGQRVCNDTRIFIYDLDLNNLKECVYVHGPQGERYINMNGQEQGPFEKAYTQIRNPKVRDYDLTVYGNYGGHRWTNTHYYLRDEYCYSKNGEWFKVYQDGTVGKLKETKKVYFSPNHEHRAVIADDWRTITIDDVSYILPLKVDAKFNTFSGFGYPEVCLFDDGTCYLEFESYEEKNKWDTDSYQYYYIYITPEEVFTIKEDEYFDLDDRNIYPIKEVKNKYLDNYIKYQGLNRDFVEKDPWKRYCMFWKGAPDKDKYSPYDYYVLDSSKKNILTFKADIPELFINGKSVYTGYILDVYFDDTTNSFCWLTFANQTIWLNCYKLK